MTARDQGFLLLTSCLGNPERKPLTVAQFRELTRNAQIMEKPLYDRELTEKDLVGIGCGHGFAKRVLELLSQTEQLNWYLTKAKQAGCGVITRLDERYPGNLRSSLGLDAPAALWVKGNTTLLENRRISLVGSRDLLSENRAFAAEVGRQAALQGYTLVSGNARGADKTAQESCLANSGTVICVVADTLESHVCRNESVLYMSEDGFDLPFSAIRALSRNRVIHALGEKTFVAQCTYGKGGTWSGTVKNLQKKWSSVFCCSDGSRAIRHLCGMGANAVIRSELSNIRELQTENISFFDRQI